LKNIGKKVSLVIGSVFFALVISELFLRVVLPKDPNQMRYYYVKDPQAGFDIAVNVPTEKHSCGQSTYDTWSNELGCFDAPYEGEEEFALLVGDSFSWGCAPFQTKYGTLVEKFLDYRILKCGVGGYGTKQEFFKTKKIIEKIHKKPRLIILGYFMNDMTDDGAFPKRTVLDGYVISYIKYNKNELCQTEEIPEEELKKMYQNYRNYGVAFLPHDAKTRVKFWIAKRSKLYNLLKKSHLLRAFGQQVGLTDIQPTETHRIWPETAPQADSQQEINSKKSLQTSPYIPIKKDKCLGRLWNDHLENLQNIVTLAKENSAELLIVIIPTKEQVYDFLRKGGDSKEYDWTLPNTILGQFCREESLHCLDLLASFRDYADQSPREHLDSLKDFYWDNDWHWNIRGNRLAGLLVSEFIIRENVLEVKDRVAKLKTIEKELKSFKN